MKIFDFRLRIVVILMKTNCPQNSVQEKVCFPKKEKEQAEVVGCYPRFYLIRVSRYIQQQASGVLLQTVILDPENDHLLLHLDIATYLV